jgi:hypothetical protein
MSRALTPTNLISNSIATLLIARCERPLEEAQSQAALGGNFAKAKM